jgi:copper chaperone CopZ
VTVVFEVEEAGCTSCAQVVREALEPLGTVLAVDVNEAADRATIWLTGTREVAEPEVARVLATAAKGIGHAYRVRPGSWRREP